MFQLPQLAWSANSLRHRCCRPRSHQRHRQSLALAASRPFPLGSIMGEGGRVEKAVREDVCFMLTMQPQTHRRTDAPGLGGSSLESSFAAATLPNDDVTTCSSLS